VLEVSRACLLGGSDDDDAKEDRDVLLSVSRVRLDPRPLPLSWSLLFPFAFLAFLFSDIECVSAARGTFSGHVAVLVK
jgi:hypothetical protein